jgi:hypothetical protein
MNNVTKKSALLVAGLSGAFGLFAWLERNPPPPTKPAEPPPLVVEKKWTIPPRPADRLNATAWDACKDFRQRRPPKMWAEVDHRMDRFCIAKGY